MGTSMLQISKIHITALIPNVIRFDDRSFKAEMKVKWDHKYGVLIW